MTNYIHILAEYAGPLFTPYLFEILLLDLLVVAVVLVGYYLQSKMDRNRGENAGVPPGEPFPGNAKPLRGGAKPAKSSDSVPPQAK